MSIHKTLSMGLGFVFAVAAAYGDSILPPGQIAPPAFFAASYAAQLIATTGPVEIHPTQDSFDVTYDEWVYRDTNNIFCSGCLTFALQAYNAGPGTAKAVAISSFVGFQTAVGYSSITVPGGPTFIPVAAYPDTVGRTQDADSIGFTFPPGPNALDFGSVSVPLIVQTDATSVVRGTIFILDDVSGSGPGIAPGPSDSTIPEPLAVSLTGVGIAAVAAVRLRKLPTGK